MKKIIAVFCLFAMVLATLTSCDFHAHKFSTDKWAKDDDYHWHACTVKDGCPEKMDKAEHTFEVVVDADGKEVNQCTVCGETNEKVSTAPQHEHAFSGEISHNENFHWYVCTVAGCYETDGKFEHIYGNPDVTYTDNKITIKSTCVDCGYETITEQIVETEVDDAISWDNMFKNFKLTNFTMDVFFADSDTNHCIVTDKAAYYCIPDYKEFYTVTNANGTCTTYGRSSSQDPFTKLSDTSDFYLVGAQTETVLQISFEDNFDKFTYDAATGSYVCEEVIQGVYYDFSGEIAEAIFCYNSVVSVTDGKISSIAASYCFSEENIDSDYNSSFRYYNIGTSVVEIPQSVIKNAINQE